MKVETTNGPALIDENGLVVHEADKQDIEAPKRDEIEACKEWLVLFGSKRETINKDRRAFSYHLKHCVEELNKARKDNGQEHRSLYVSNGAFIKAASELGYRIKSSNTKNAYFNLSCSSYRVYESHLEDLS